MLFHCAGSLGTGQHSQQSSDDHQEIKTGVSLALILHKTQNLLKGTLISEYHQENSEKKRHRISILVTNLPFLLDNFRQEGVSKPNKCRRQLIVTILLCHDYYTHMFYSHIRTNQEILKNIQRALTPTCAANLLVEAMK